MSRHDRQPHVVVIAMRDARDTVADRDDAHIIGQSLAVCSHDCCPNEIGC